MNITAMIPARIGSERLKMKNLALLNGHPLIYYAIKAAKDSGVFNKIILNSDNNLFEKIADRYHIDFYKRPSQLGGSSVKMDDVNMDFIKNNPCDVLAIVNTPSPLQTGDEVAKAINFFKDNNFDSMIAISENYVHAVYNGIPINFDPEEQFQRTQDLLPVSLLIYSIMAWNTKTFISEYEIKGRAFFCGKTGYFKASKESALLVKNEDDLQLIDRIMRSKENKIKYDIIAEGN